MNEWMNNEKHELKWIKQINQRKKSKQINSVWINEWKRMKGRKNDVWFERKYRRQKERNNEKHEWKFEINE